MLGAGNERQSSFRAVRDHLAVVVLLIPEQFALLFRDDVAGQKCLAFSYGGFDVHSGRVRLSYQFQP
jgi:hypothetical protein